MALFCLIFGGFGVFFAVNTDFCFSIWCLMPALFLIMLGFEVVYRYELTVFTYILGENDLIILKKAGKKEECVCHLPLHTALVMEKLPKRKMRRKWKKEYGKIAIRYNFSQTACPKNAYSVLFSYENKIAEIMFEPNENMVMAMQYHIREKENFDFLQDTP